MRSTAPGWPAVLTHGSVTLRPFRRGDAREWSRVRRANQDWLAHWEPASGTRWHEAHSPAAFRVLYRELRKAAKQGHSWPFAVCYQGALVGGLTVGNIIRRAFCSAYAGYWIDQRHAGLGITPTALALVVDHAFARGGLHRIEINIQPNNQPSKRVAEKLGFREEALHRNYLFIDGAWRDHIGYAVTVEDLQGTRGMVARLDDAIEFRP